MTDSTAARVLDPMCGASLRPEQVAVRWTYIGQIYSFCGQECWRLFARAPEIWVARAAHEPFAARVTPTDGVEPTDG